MATYVFGPINGDMKSLNYAIEQLGIDPETDKLWFSGNVVGDGQDNLALLEFIKGMTKQAVMVLGRNEMQFMAAAEGCVPQTGLFLDLLNADSLKDWVKWLAWRPLLHHEAGFTMIHAGMPAEWSFSQARTFAIEAESSLSMGNRQVFFENVMADGPGPSRWHAKLRGWKRTRFIINSLTRMTYFDANGRFNFSFEPGEGGDDVFPWYFQSAREMAGQKVICAYALQTGQAAADNVYPLQWPDQNHVFKVMRLAEQPEMFSFLRG